jgi:hypothetical protein
MVGMTEGDKTSVVHTADMGVFTEKRWMGGVAPDASSFIADCFGVTTDLTVATKGNLVALPIGIWG